MTSPRQTPASESRSRVEILDLLRMFAVLAVVLFHYGFRGAAADGYTATSLPDLQWFAKYGDFGVQLFFVISGFVIAYSAEGRSAINFAIARGSRIYPAFFLCMTLTFFATIAIGAPRFETTFLHWFANLFIVAPALKQPFMDGAYWSIVYEITFYGWVALFLATGHFRKHIELIIVSWMAISLLNEAVLHSSILLRLFLTNQSGFFAAGLLLYEMYTGRRTLLIKILLVLAAVVSINQAIGNAQWVREHYQVAIDDRVIALLCLASIGAVALALRVRRVPLPATAGARHRRHDLPDVSPASAHRLHGAEQAPGRRVARAACRRHHRGRRRAFLADLAPRRAPRAETNEDRTQLRRGAHRAARRPHAHAHPRRPRGLKKPAPALRPS